MSLGLLRARSSHGGTSAILNVCSLYWLPFLTQSLQIPTASSVWISWEEWSACFHTFIHSVLPVLLGSLPIVAGSLVLSVAQMQTIEKSAHSFVMLHNHQALKTFVRNMVQRYASSSKRLFESTGSFQMTRSWSLVVACFLRQMKAAMQCFLDSLLSQRCEITELWVSHRLWPTSDDSLIGITVVRYAIAKDSSTYAFPLVNCRYIPSTHYWFCTLMATYQSSTNNILVYLRKVSVYLYL